MFNAFTFRKLTFKRGMLFTDLLIDGWQSRNDLSLFELPFNVTMMLFSDVFTVQRCQVWRVAAYEDTYDLPVV